jgi:hypothetical protein
MYSFKDGVPYSKLDFFEFFKGTCLEYLPSISINPSVTIIPKKANEKNMMTSEIDIPFSLYCHHATAVLIGPNETRKCLCPPNYFGFQCQWQNQCVSLILQLG